MLIRNIFLLTTLCLIFSAMSCSSDTSSEYPANDYDRPERNMDRENREEEKQRRDAERAGREEERQRRDSEYKKNRESGEHRGQQRHDQDQKEHEFESKPPRDMKMAAKELGISPEALRKALGGPPPEIQQGAKKLGISEERLLDALGIREHPEGHKGPRDNNPLKIAADKLGVDFKEFQDALGGPPPDVEAASEKLGIDVEKIREAMAATPKKGKSP